MARIFGETFRRDAPEGTFLDRYRNFDAYPYPWRCTDRNARYDPDNLSVKGGKLNARLWTDPTRGTLVAAPWPRLPRNLVCGRFRTRMRATPTPGFKVAILLWPWSDTWPDEGEIDFPECNLDDPTVMGFAHHADPGGSQDVFPTTARISDWHVYETVWRPHYVAFTVDGIEIGRSTTHIPSTPMRWVLQCETAGKPHSDAQARVQFDWISAYT